MDTALLALSFGTSIMSGAFGASAQRQNARAQMEALKLEKRWNIGVMERNKRDIYESNILESWGSGIDPTSGSNAAIIKQNQRVLQDEIEFKKQQYDIEIANLKAQSKQKFLGIF